MITTLALLTVLTAPASGLQPKNRPYDAQHYKLEVRQGEGGTFNNVLTATLKPSKALTEIELDAYDLKITQAKVDGEVAEFKQAAQPEMKTGTVTLKVKKPLAPGKDAQVEITYSVTAATENEGLFTSSEPDAPANALPGYFTHFEPYYAQRFFPVNDTPADKATSEIIAIVDGKYTVVSNGTKTKDETFAENGKNLRRVEWKQEQPHSPYLIALAIAPLEPVLVTDDIPSTIWVPPGTKDRAFVAVDVLKQLFNYQVGLVGTKYPWSKLDVVAVPRFFWSGMENTSVIFERTTRLLVDHKNDQLARTVIVGLLSHEMAHQYFGNFVTCAWWNEVWLNEGMATWMGDLAWDDYNNNDEAEIRHAMRLIDGYFVEEEGPHSHPLVVKNFPAEQAFDSTSYTKGARVMAMLDQWIGRAEMKKALKLYLEKNAGKPVTSDDFFKAVFESTKKEKELKPFKEAWLTRKGYPVLTVDTTFGNGKLTVTVKQQPNAAGEKGAFVFKLPIGIHRKNEPKFDQDAEILVDKPEVKVVLDVQAAPEWINWNRGFGALARINPSSINEERLVDAARYDPDSVWRLASTLQLLGEMGSKAPKSETKPTDMAMGAILDVLTKDPSPYVREAVLERLANTRFKKLPSEFSAPLLALAKRPENIEDDPAGYIRVKNAAMQALGRTDNADGHKWILDELGKRDIDINYLAAYAKAAARIGTPAAVGQFRAALVTQKGRGMPYYRRTAEAVGSGMNLEFVQVIKDVMKANPMNNEFCRAVTDDLPGNHELRETEEFAKAVRDLVLDEKTFTTACRADFLFLLDDVKYDFAKGPLTEIAEKSTSDEIKSIAKRTLDANFPAAAPPAKKDDKKKK
ncbi:MAG: M1 family aminopeptidase [Myxococcaceae bacterium]